MAQEVDGTIVRPNDRTSTLTTDAAVSTAVIEAVTEAAGTQAENLPVLNEVVDTDALDALFAGSETTGTIQFRYAGCDVTVSSDHTVHVRPSVETSP
jgi:hypothetical protein